MKKIRETVVIALMSVMFWGILYPQFNLTEDSYHCLQKQEKNPEEDFLSMLNAQKGEVIIKSRIWEWVKKEAENKS